MKLSLFATWILVGLVTCTPSDVDAQEQRAARQRLRIILSTDDGDGLVTADQVVKVTARIENRSDRNVRGELTWRVHTVAFDPEEPKRVVANVAAGGSSEFIHEVVLPTAGFADVECELSSSDSEQSRSRRIRLGRDPEQIEVPLTRQSDFDQFWAESLKELKAIPADFQVAEQPDLSDDARIVYEVTMKSFDNVHVRGWLEVPREADDVSGKKITYPAVIRVPGYGGNMKPIEKWTDMIVYSFNPRAHGNSVDEVPGKPVDYWIRGLDDKQDYFYRGAYLDCVRAVDYIATRDDVDQNRIAVWGGSQGGGFALASAALDPRIDLCAADIPFLCDWVKYFQLTVWPEMDGWIDGQQRRTWDSTLRTLSYFDTMNMAERIRCPTFMGVGLQDRVCPPTTNFAAFNRIAGEKSFKIYPHKGHGLGGDHHALVWRWIRKSFDLPEHPKG